MAVNASVLKTMLRSPAIRRRIRKSAILVLSLATALLPPLLFAHFFNAAGNLSYIWVHGILSVLLGAPAGFFFSSLSQPKQMAKHGATQRTKQGAVPQPVYDKRPGSADGMLSGPSDSAAGQSYGRYIAGGLFFILQTALVLLVITIVSITSASSYAAWFSFVSREGASSTISYYFVLKLLLFSSFTGAAIIRGNILIPLLLLSFVLLTLFSVMFTLSWLVLGAMISLILALFLMDIRSRGGYERRGLFSIFQYVLLCILLAAILAGIITASPGRGNASLLPDRLTNSVFRIWTDFPLAVDIPGFGGNYGTGGIDGSAALSSSPVFRIRHPGRRGDVLHLRSQVFDQYTDSAWRISNRFINTSDNGLLRRSSIPENPSPGDMEITTLAEYYSSIPHLLETAAIIDTGEEVELSYASANSGFLFARPFTRGRRFFLINEDSRTQGNTDDMETASGSELDAQDLSYYLQISNYISEDVRELGAFLKRDSPEESIRSAREYLRENFDYTLNYPRVARRIDVVSHFLNFADAGYCTQFASSMTILLRTMDIPSRYVTGFYTRLSRDSDETVIRGLNAHAWCEAWIEGRGWTVVEATPPMMQEAGEQDPSRYNPYADRLTGRQLEGVFGRSVDPPAPEVLPGTGEREKSGLSMQNLLVKAGIVLSIILGSFFVIILISAVCFLLLPVRLRIILKLHMILRLTMLRIPHPQVSSETAPVRSGWQFTLTLLEENSLIEAGERQLLRPLLLRFCYTSRKQERSELQTLSAGLGTIARRLFFNSRIGEELYGRR